MQENVDFILGTADISAVFFGSKGDTEKECKDGPSSSLSTISTPAITREHVLQVSTYQVAHSYRN